jgi:hypothetical protein
MLLGLAESPLAAAATFSVTATFDCEIGNDPQIGPTGASNTGTGMGMRNIATRRRVSYCTYNIAGLRGSGQVFLNVSLNLLGYDPGAVNVYGVLEPVEHLVGPGINWTNAPGVQNDPMPALDTDVVLDAKDLTPMLLRFDAPARDVRISTDASKALADFLNSDTDGFVALMFAPEGVSKAIVRTIDYGATGGIRIQGEIGGQPVSARDPSPADKAADVYVGATLSWTPGVYATVHNVYLGTSLADMNTATADKPGNVSVSLAQDANTYDPTGDLKYGQTYYWRVDEVNGPNGTVYRGNVWSFTTEPLLYPVKGIVATASSSETVGGPDQTINGSGLTGDLHSTTDTTMWVSSKTGPQPAWIRYEFDKVYRLREMWVWNYNNIFEGVLGFGFKDVTVEYSTNGTDWTLLKDVQFAQGLAQDSYAHNATVDFGGIAAKYVRLTAKTNWGGVVHQYGLSEVRFLYVPTYASNPTPAAAQTGVSPDVKLQWRSGREAATHQVYFSADKQAVTDGKVLAGTTAQASFDPGSLDLAKTYYWKIGEVNQATTPSTWQGDVWSFTTSEYLVIDDFERYTDAEGSRIYETWIDGYGTKTNGSQVGYNQEPFAERTTVHGGKQAMPLTYNNSTAAYSEAERTLDPAQDWTIHEVKTLSLYFYGPATNKGGQLYLKVNGKKVAYAGAAGDLNKAQWVQWTVDLASLGANPKKVTSLVIGVDGAGVSGVLYIDDVQLRP